MDITTDNIKKLEQRLVIQDDNINNNYNANKAYDPYKIPPDLDFAKSHAIARRVCKEINLTTENCKSCALCPCCYLPLNNTQLPVCSDNKSLYHLGVCFPLYFTFIKFGFCLLVITFLGSGLYSLITDFTSTNCNENIGYDSAICEISYLNTMNVNFQDMENPLNVITILLMIIAIEIFRKKHREIINDCNSYSDTNPTHNSILISHLPDDFNTKDLEELIKSILPNESPKIIREHFIYDIAPYADLYRKRKNLILLRRKNKISEIEYLTKTLAIDTRINLFQKDFMENTNKISFTGRVLVTLDSSVHAKKIIVKWRMSFITKLFIIIIRNPKYFPNFIHKYMYKNNVIGIHKAPAASDILWENLGRKASGQKPIQKLRTVVGSIVLLIIGFIMIDILKRAIKVDEQEVAVDINPYLSVTISFASSTIVALTNTILGIFIRKFARQEKHKTQTSFFISVGYKLTAALFCNMGLTALLANFLNEIKGNANETYRLSLSGLLQDIFFLFITNSYISSIFNYFDLVWGAKKIRRYLAEKAGPNCRLTQEEANSLFEGHPVDMALRYANILKTLFFTGIYAPFIPAGVPLSMIGLFICYWVDKYLLLRRYVCPNKLGKALPKAMLNGLRLYVLLFAIGNLVLFFLPSWAAMNHTKLQSFVGNPKYWVSIVAFCVALVYNILPMNKLNKKMFTIDKKKVGLKINDNLKNETNLHDDYDFFHPVLKENIKMKLQNGEMKTKLERESWFINVNKHLDKVYMMNNNDSDIIQGDEVRKQREKERKIKLMS